MRKRYQINNYKAKELLPKIQIMVETLKVHIQESSENVFQGIVLSDVFQRILKYEQEIWANPHEECIEKIEDEHIIKILQEICKEEEVHIELAKELFKIIEEE